MSDFTRLRPAIGYYEQLCRTAFGTNFASAATAHFGDLQRNYYSQTDNPDYSSSLNKFCYLFKYAVAHGYYIYSSLKRARKAMTGNIFSPTGINIACIGGGPGSEIIGIIRYIREVEPSNKNSPVNVVIYDKEESWKDVCHRVLDCFQGDANISLQFVPMDATDQSSYGPIDFSPYGIVISSFFLSETRKLRIATAARGFWKHLLKTMSPGAWLVVVDFADQNGAAWNYLSTLIASAGRPFRDVISDSATAMGCPDSKTAVQSLETELDHRPKKNATNLVRVVAAG